MTSDRERLDKLTETVVDDRERLDETAQRIRDKLTPGQLFDEILSQGGEPARNAVARLGHTIVQHPVPALLIGTALVWLALESRRPGHDPGSDDTPPS
jgi:hypothetical protein